MSRPAAAAAAQGSDKNITMYHDSCNGSVVTSSSIRRDSFSRNLNLNNTSIQSPRSSIRGSFTRQPFKRRSARLSELTVDKLQFDKLDKLYGRDQEVAQLEALYKCIAAVYHHATGPKETPSSNIIVHPLATHQTRRCFVTIPGVSGCGKTALAESVRPCVHRTNGLFLQGKFPQQMKLSRQTVEPYTAFSSVCHELCDAATSSDKLNNYCGYKPLRNSSLEDFKSKVASEIGTHSGVLTRVIPSLKPLFPLSTSDNDTSTNDPQESMGLLESQHQFKHAFRLFIRVISSFAPLVIMIDDIQWADVASMELLETILTDREICSLMVIGCYRDDERYNTMPFIQSIETLEKLCDTSGFNIVTIPITNLNVGQVNELLADLISSDLVETTGLAELVQKKTLGNAFFVKQFLSLLVDMNLLTFNFGALKWAYDLAQIQSETVATENVVSLMNSKMRNLPACIVKLLPVMACLGSSFSFAIFDVAVSNCSRCLLDNNTASHHTVHHDSESEEESSVFSESTTSELLQICLDQGFLEIREPDMYQWVHDNIQESAFLLLGSEDEAQAFKLRLGKILYQKLSPAELEQYLFTVANLLSTTNMTAENDTSSDAEALLSRSSSTSVVFATLFLRAGAKAIAHSAFDQSVGYLLQGIALLPTDHWQACYQLSLDLFSTAAEAEYCCGQFDAAVKYSDQVIQQENTPLIEKRRVYSVVIDSYCGAGKVAEAMTLTRDILSRLGITFPKRAVKFHVLRGVIQMKTVLKKATARKYTSNLPTMTNPLKLWSMELLDRFVTLTYSLVKDQGDLLPLAILKGMNIVLKDGVSFVSPVFLALVALIITSIGDLKGGTSLADEAIHMLREVKGSRLVEPRVLLIVHCYVVCWQRPLALSIKPLLGGLQLGMATGDTFNACWCGHMMLVYKFRTGTSLQTLIADCTFWLEQFQEVQKNNKPTIVLRLLLQTMLLLTGDNSFDGTLSGDVCQQVKDLAEVPADSREYLKFCIYRFLMHVQFLLSKHSLVYESIKKTDMDNGGYEKGFPGLASIYFIYAHNALSMISLYRETKEKKYLKLAKKFAGKIKCWALKLNTNVTHFDSILDAEFCSMWNRHESASKHYEMAIVYAGRRGLIQDRALAHERYGEHLQRLGRSEYKADVEYHLCESVRLYSEWGAYAKVNQLHDLYYDLVHESFLEAMSCRDDP